MSCKDTHVLNYMTQCKFMQMDLNKKIQMHVSQVSRIVQRCSTRPRQVLGALMATQKSYIAEYDGLLKCAYFPNYNNFFDLRSLKQGHHGFSSIYVIRHVAHSNFFDLRSLNQVHHAFSRYLWLWEPSSTEFESSFKLQLIQKNTEDEWRRQLV